MPFGTITVLLIVCSFVIVTAFTVKFLLSFSHFLQTVSHTVATIEKELDETTQEIEGILTQTVCTAEDVQAKLTGLDELFGVARDLGVTADQASSMVYRATNAYQEQSSSRSVDRAVQVIHTSELGFSLWRAWRRGQR